MIVSSCSLHVLTRVKINDGFKTGIKIICDSDSFARVLFLIVNECVTNIRAKHSQSTTAKCFSCALPEYSQV